MGNPARALTSLFLVEPAASRSAHPPAVLRVVGLPQPTRLVIAIVGPPPVVALARDVAAMLARRNRAEALLLTWGAGPSTRRKWWRRVVELAVDSDEIAAGIELAGAIETWQGGPAVVALCGPRHYAFDQLLNGCDLAVAATLAGSPAGLAEAVAIGLMQAAPATCSVAVRRAAPLDPWRNRAAVKAIAEAFDASPR